MRFVSLGGDCQPAYQIRRVTGIETALFFDWITCPIYSVMPLVRSGFADAFASEMLDWKWLPDESAWLVRDVRYGIESKHHFKTQTDNDVRKAIAFFRRAGDALLDILNEGEPIVFVRRWNRSADQDAGFDVVRQELAPLTSNGSTGLYLDERLVIPILAPPFFASPNPYAGRWEGDDALYERNFATAKAIR